MKELKITTTRHARMLDITAEVNQLAPAAMKSGRPMTVIKNMLGGLVLVLAFFAAADGGVVMLKDGPPLTVSEILADEDGNLYCQTDNRPLIVPKTFYSYVRTLQPAELLLAEEQLRDGKPAAAEKLFREAAARYKFLGWKAACIAGLARALLRQGREDAALEELEAIANDHIADPEFTQGQYMEAFRLLVGIYRRRQLEDKAAALLEEMLAAARSEYIVWAYLQLGDMARGQGRTEAAELNYLQAVIYGGKNIPSRAEAIFKLAEMLKKRAAPGFKLYRDMLKKECPDSIWARQIE